jgi:hypothetical protein
LLREHDFIVDRPENSEHPIVDRVDQVVYNTTIAMIYTIVTPIAIGVFCTGAVTAVGISAVSTVIASPWSIRASILQKKPIIYRMKVVRIFPLLADD